MSPYPARYSVLILDNASIHKSQYLRDICEENGIRLEFLPPYSTIQYVSIWLFSFKIIIYLRFYYYRSSKHSFTSKIINVNIVIGWNL